MVDRCFSRGEWDTFLIYGRSSIADHPGTCQLSKSDRWARLYNKKFTDDPPPSTFAVGTIGSRPDRWSDLFPLWNCIVLLVGSRWVMKRAGWLMVGSFELSGPLSIINIERLGSASVSLEAMMHPAVPPGKQSERGSLDNYMCRTLP